MTRGYSSTLMDHFEAPRNAGRMPEPDAVGHADVAGRAPKITICLKLCGEHVERATFQSFGCGASIAAGSVLTEMVPGKTVDQCRLLSPQDVENALDGLPANKRFCAALSIMALNDALDCVAKRSAE